MIISLDDKNMIYTCIRYSKSIPLKELARFRLPKRKSISQGDSCQRPQWYSLTVLFYRYKIYKCINKPGTRHLVVVVCYGKLISRYTVNPKQKKKRKQQKTCQQ